jgi:uncharacterized membrane protein
MSDTYGPVDFILLEFPDQQPSGEAAEALLALVDAGIIRLYDITAIRKGADGSFGAIEIADLGDEHAATFAQFAGAGSGLFSDDDLAEAAAALEPGTIGVLILFENAWAAPFVSAASRAGGQVVASARIPAQDIMDALDAVEASG